MKTLKDLAGLYKTLAQTNLVTGKTRAYKTGNLYTQVTQRNRAETMITEPSKGKYVITLNYAPDGAEYGKFVEEGTSKMEARPFAENAANSPEMKVAVDEFMNGKVDELLVDWEAKFSKDMKKMGFVVK
jgi:HK97 gp10 family phage protein